MSKPLNTPLSFYHILHNIAVAFPATYEGTDGSEQTCKRLNGFAYLKSEDELNSDNLNKSARHIGKNLYFGRSWYNSGQQASKMSFDYPLLAISRSDMNFKSPFVPKSEDCINFNLYIFDQLPGKCSTCKEGGYCNTRTWEEMEDDLTKLMKVVLKTLSNYVYAVLIKDGEEVGEGYYDSTWLECLKEKNEIDSFECVDELTNHIQNTAQINADTFCEVYNDVLGMIAVNLTVCFKDCETEKPVKMNYDILETQHVRADEGCKTC